MAHGEGHAHTWAGDTKCECCESSPVNCKVRSIQEKGAPLHKGWYSERPITSPGPLHSYCLPCGSDDPFLPR